MKEIIKKIICILTVVTVVSIGLAGCSKNNDNIGDAEVNEQLEAGNTVENSDKEAESYEENKEENKMDNKEDKEENSIVTPVPEQTAKPEMEEKKEISLSDMANKLISVIPADEHNMTQIPKELYKDMYGIDSSQFEDVLVYGSMMSVKANEIILIKVKNEADLSAVKKLLEERKAQVYKTWEQYLPDQFELVKQAKISVSGKYAALIIAPYSDKINDTFKQMC